MISTTRKAHLKSITAARLSKCVREQDSPAPEPPQKRRKTRSHAINDPPDNTIDTLSSQIKELKLTLQLAQTKIQQLSTELQQKDLQCADFQTAIDEHRDQSKSRAEHIKSTQESLFLTQERLKIVQRRVRRLEREKVNKGIIHHQQVCRANSARATASKIFTDLENFTLNAERQLSDVKDKAQKDLKKLQCTSKNLRRKIKQLDSQQRRARNSLHTSQRQLKAVRTWKSTKDGVYTMEARKLFRELHSTGCSPERVGDAIKTCAEAFGIRITQIPSRRTVLRCRDEGGCFGMMQIGREIMNTEGEMIKL